MISDEVVQRIRRYRSEGVSLREISRATGISVNTIRRYLADPMLGMVPRPKQIRKSNLDISSGLGAPISEAGLRIDLI